MPQSTKEKSEIEKSGSDEREKASWDEDQKRRGYYYDDAHGYEVYMPDEDEDSDPDGPKPIS